MNSKANHEEECDATTPYEKCLRELYQIQNVKDGLNHMLRLYHSIGCPLDALRPDRGRDGDGVDRHDIGIIHVAGTNGKGSVSLKIAKALEYSSYKVGLLTSPHIASYRERIQINSHLISEQHVAHYLSRILNICREQAIPATFFEITTALAYLYFYEQQVNFVVIETGLGGRLDATNVVQHDGICIITSIGLEHTALLGDTVEKIAIEKAGIIKCNVPVVVGPNVPHEVIRSCAIEKEAEGYYTCEDILGEKAEEHDCKMRDSDGSVVIDYDLENSRTARAALHVLQTRKSSSPSTDSKVSSTLLSEQHIKMGISHRPPCRFELVNWHDSVLTIMDIAHNPPAMKCLFAKLKMAYPSYQKRIVVGFSSDKDVTLCSQLVLEAADNDPSLVHLVQASNHRAAKFEYIFEMQPLLLQSNYDCNDRSVTTQVKSALTLTQQILQNKQGADKKDEMVIICGSVFLMQEAREALGIDEPVDSKYVMDFAGVGLHQCKIAKEKTEKTSSTA